MHSFTFRPKECTKCNGDLVPDEDEWRYFQCGQRYYPSVCLPVVVNVREPGQRGGRPQGTANKRKDEYPFDLY